MIIGGRLLRLLLLVSCAERCSCEATMPVLRCDACVALPCQAVVRCLTLGLDADSDSKEDDSDGNNNAGGRHCGFGSRYCNVEEAQGRI